MRVEITPEAIEENIEAIGRKEGLALLREIIGTSGDLNIRKRALNIFGTIDNGKNFAFLEHLFLSDEEIEVRLIAGKILKDKYYSNKKMLPLLEFTLR